MSGKGDAHTAITIVDVARAAGVSYATVSRVINNNSHVKPSTRAAVLAAMSQLGYVTNLPARRLATGRTSVIGLVTQGLGSNYVGEIVRGISEYLERMHYDLVLYTTRHRSDGNVYLTNIARGSVDGLLLLTPHLPDAYAGPLARVNVPYIIIDYQGTNDAHRTVIAENYQGGYAATTYLLGLGHRRIGHITGDMEHFSANERLAGYRAALAAHGVCYDPALVARGSYWRRDGFAGAEQLLGLPEPPSAIFAASDEMAFGVIEAAQQRQLQIPEQLSVIGFDDVPQAATVFTPLTTVRQPLQDMGCVAAQQLLSLIDHPATRVSRVMLPTRLVVRQSAGPPAVPSRI